MENDFGTPAGKNLPAISQSLYGLRSEDFSFGVSPQKTPMQELKTPPVLMEKNQNVIISTKEESKSGSPPDMKVPLHKLFKFPGRYKSPTDRLISPVSECLRNRKMFYQPSILYSPPPKVSNGTCKDLEPSPH
eukprot:Gb_03841 [translate_table: standard]